MATTRHSHDSTTSRQPRQTTSGAPLREVFNTASYTPESGSPQGGSSESGSPPPTGDQDQDLPTNFWAVRVRRHRPGLACTLPKASPELLVGRYLAQLGRSDWWKGCWWSQLPLGPLREFRQGSPYKNLRELREQTYSCVPELKITAAFLRRRRLHFICPVFGPSSGSRSVSSSSA